MSQDRSRRPLLVRVERKSDWTVWMHRDKRPSGDRHDDLLGEPGLWRTVRRNGDVARIFDCPSFEQLERLAGGEGQPFDGAALRTETREWARSTAHGEVPPTWTAPEPDEVDCWHSPERLAVHAGPHLVKGEVECDLTKLRLFFPELVFLDGTLPDARWDWARAACLDTQSRWHMVRFGLAGGSVRAEVDLSGVPAALARPLFGLALEALVFTVGWALPAFALIADAGLESRMLDRGPSWAGSPLDDAPVNNARQSALAG